MTQTQTTFELGARAADTLTGFFGVITGVARYITGCDQYCLQPPVKDDGTWQEGRWFDETRVRLVPAVRVEVPGAAADPGGPPSTPAPTK